MVSIQKFESKTGKVSKATFDEKVFGQKLLGKTLREAVLMYEANARQGTVQTKERGDVSGSTKKPWKQKGTGRARAGSVKSPIWRGGGTVFGPHPRDYGWSMPRKALRTALRSALLGKLRDNEVSLLAGLSMDKPSAAAARKVLQGLNVNGSCCLVLEERNENIWKSFRNFPRISVKTADELNAFDVCFHRQVLVTDKAMDRLKARLGETKAPAKAGKE